MKSLMNKLKEAFNFRAAARLPLPAVAVTKLPSNDFVKTLQQQFNYEISLDVMTALARLQIPAPQGHEEFMNGRDAILIFMNRYGVVIRILSKKDANNCAAANATPWVSNPIATLDAGSAVIEICAGGKQETKKENIQLLRDELNKGGRKFWDYKFSNVARIPISTLRFPEGVPIVIDRGAVHLLSAKMKPIKDAMEAAQEVAAALDKLYAPLKHAFKECLMSGRGMERFWGLCESYVQKGILVAGWNTPQCEDATQERCAWGDNTKTFLAEQVAKYYEERLANALIKPVNSAASAIPQSPLQLS